MSSVHTLQTAIVLLFGAALTLNLWLQHRRGVRAFVFSRQRGKRLLELIAIGGLFAWFALVGSEGAVFVHARLGLVWIDSRLADAIGAMLMSVGLIIGLLAYLHMGRSWRIGIDEDAHEKLVADGVFAWSRNPIYLFIDMLAIGVLLASGTVFFIVTSPIVLLGIHFRILEEERFLVRRYGGQFESYSAATSRYLGRSAKRPT